MSNRTDRAKNHWKSRMMACIAFLPVFSGLAMISPPLAAAESAGVHVHLPDNVQPGEEWSLRVSFDQAPPEKKFYRLFVKIDGSAVAFADLSRGRMTSINIPAVASGTHRLSLFWKNAPGGKPVVVRRTFKVPSH